MNVIDALISTLANGEVVRVQVGLFWTAVLVNGHSGLSCGVASTPHNHDPTHVHQPEVKDAGRLTQLKARDLAELAHSGSLTEASIGLAAINALLPRTPERWVELNGEDYLASVGKDKSLAVIGHFPFVNRLKPFFKDVWVLELQPIEDDLPANEAPRVIPKADIVAITATALINHTFDELIKLCRLEAEVMMLGPSTPLSPLMFEHGLSLLSGTVVLRPEEVMLHLVEGASFHQMRGASVKLVTMTA